MGNLLKYLEATAVLTVALLFIFSCSNPDEDNSQKHDSRLINTVAGEAWTDDFFLGNRDGIFFNSDGSYIWIHDSPYGVWAHKSEGTWETSGGNRLFLSASDGNSQTLSYQLRGDNTVVINGGHVPNWVFNRTQNITVGKSQIQHDERLINTVAGEAWITAPPYYGYGFIFNADGTYYAIRKHIYDIGFWSVNGNGTWRTNGRDLILTGDGHYGNTTILFSFSKDNSYILLDRKDFYRFSNLTIFGIEPIEHDSRLINAAINEAWINNKTVGNREGFILNADGTYIVVRDRSGIWSNIDNGTWQTSGNSLFLSRSESGRYINRAGNFTLSNNGNTLSVLDETLHRTSDVIIDASIFGEPEHDSRLINAVAGEAWYVSIAGSRYREFFIFRANGTFAYAYGIDTDDVFVIRYRGAWQTLDNSYIIFRYDGYDLYIRNPYTVINDDSITIDNLSLNRISNITIDFR